MLKAICKSLVKQGWFHKANITAFYRIMYQAAQAEFTEDNKPTLDTFLQECFDKAKQWVTPN